MTTTKKFIIGILLLLAGLATGAASAQGIGYTPPPYVLYDSTGNPFPTGSGTALNFMPPAFTCYTIVASAVVPCSFSGGGASGVASINSTTGAFTFNGPGVNCVTTTCTFTGGGSFPTGATNQMLYYAANGTAVSVLTLGTNLSITSGVLNATGGGGSTSNPSTCTASSATDICLTLAPYYASPNGDITTTTSGSLTSGSTTATVASCSTFVAGNGVLITGAGASGANYIGTVSTCSGTTLTFSPATSTTVASGVVVQHDETAAITAAYTSLASTGGRIYFPLGLFLVNGPLQDTSGANAILPMPHVLYQGTPPAVPISFIGSAIPTCCNLTKTNASIIQTSATSGNVIGGYYNAGSYTPFTNVWLVLEKLVFRAPTNPGVVDVNATYVTGLHAEHVWFDTPSSSLPSNAAGGAMYFPALSNNLSIIADDITAVAYYNGFKIGEHAHVGSMYGSALVNGFVFDTRSNGGGIPTNESNGISVDYLWCGSCTNAIATGSIGATVDILMASFEGDTYGVNDPSNLLFGKINYKWNLITNSGILVKNGGVNVQMYNLLYPSARVGDQTPDLRFYVPGTNTTDVSMAYVPFGTGSAGTGAFQFNMGYGLGYGVKFYNPTGPAVQFVGTGSTATSAYAVTSVAGTNAGYPNWVELFYIPSTATGLGAPYTPSSALLRADTGATAGLNIDAAATGAPVSLSTQDTLRLSVGYATAPSGACTVNGLWILSEDGHATFCASGTWVTKI
jgi:hypothetical protein